MKKFFMFVLEVIFLIWLLPAQHTLLGRLLLVALVFLFAAYAALQMINGQQKKEEARASELEVSRKLFQACSSREERLLLAKEGGLSYKLGWIDDPSL